MNDNEKCGSVSQLLQRIDQEYEAAKRGLLGLAYGTSQHDFIHARMEQVAVYAEELEKVVGYDEAIRLVCQHHDQIIR